MGREKRGERERERAKARQREIKKERERQERCEIEYIKTIKKKPNV